MDNTQLQAKIQVAIKEIGNSHSLPIDDTLALLMSGAAMIVYSATKEAQKLLLPACELALESLRPGAIDDDVIYSEEPYSNLQIAIAKAKGRKVEIR